MSALREFSGPIAKAKAYLTEAESAARHMGFLQVKFAPLFGLFKDLDNAMCKGEAAEVSRIMKTLSGQSIVSNPLYAPAHHPEPKERDVQPKKPRTVIDPEELSATRTSAGQKGGTSRSPAKAKAARKNGVKGGRPKSMQRTPATPG